MIEEYQAIYAESVALARFMDVDPEPCPFCEGGSYHICAYNQHDDCEDHPCADCTADTIDMAHDEAKDRGAL